MSIKTLTRFDLLTSTALERNEEAVIQLVVKNFDLIRSAANV